MSPRSEEFLAAAQRKLEAARAASQADPASAVSAAYYAMLYAARAALSERDVYARTHRGTWHEFRRLMVGDGDFDPELVTAAEKVQPEREQADYEAWDAPIEEAVRVIELAERFLDEVERVVG